MLACVNHSRVITSLECVGLLLKYVCTYVLLRMILRTLSFLIRAYGYSKYTYMPILYEYVFICSSECPGTEKRIIRRIRKTEYAVFLGTKIDHDMGMNFIGTRERSFKVGFTIKARFKIE